MKTPKPPHKPRGRTPRSGAAVAADILDEPARRIDVTKFKRWTPKGVAKLFGSLSAENADRIERMLKEGDRVSYGGHVSF